MDLRRQGSLGDRGSMDLRRQGSLGDRGSLEPRRQGSLGARGSTELSSDIILVESFSGRPNETLVESFSATHREGRSTGSWSILRATTPGILALSLTIEAPFGSDIMNFASGEHMLMMSECKISSDTFLSVQSGLACFFVRRDEIQSEGPRRQHKNYRVGVGSVRKISKPKRLSYDVVCTGNVMAAEDQYYRPNVVSTVLYIHTGIH
jgi:hypothetical protein